VIDTVVLTGLVGGFGFFCLRAMLYIAGMGGRAGNDEEKKAKRAEFAERLAALQALKEQLTPARLTSAFNNFQNIVQDQQRIEELANKHPISSAEARIIMNQATISAQAEGDDDSVGPAQIWDRADRLAGIYVEGLVPIDERTRGDIEAVRGAVFAGEEPILLNDEANILASTMLQATNAAKMP